MIIDCVSDLHGYFPVLDGGDLLIVAGDCTTNDTLDAWDLFFKWIEKQKYTKKVLVAGNHDNFCKNWAICGSFTNDEYEQMYPGEKPIFDYLCDSGTEFEGLKIWGSPWTTSFPEMNPICKAFTVDNDYQLCKKCNEIPFSPDILVTHSPPFGILDEVKDYNIGKILNVGSPSLRRFIIENRNVIKLHVFGHIHESYGHSINHNGINFVNASHVNERYEPVNKPIRIIL